MLNEETDEQSALWDKSYVCTEGIHVQGPIGQEGVKKFVSFLLHTDQIFQGGGG